MSIDITINLPLELAPVDKCCMICFDDLKFPVFCHECKQPACFRCLELWFAQKAECPTCRCPTKASPDVAEKQLYSCAGDDLLAELFCEQCNKCFCRKCYDTQVEHLCHPVRELDALREEVHDAIEKVRQLPSEAVRRSTLTRVKALLPGGHPHELVQQRHQVMAEIEKAMPVAVSAQTAGKKPPYVLSNEEYTNHRCKIIDINSDNPVGFSEVDRRGNQWTLVVYPRGFSGGKDKFVSLYLTLLAGKPGRYEYRYTIYESNGVKPLAEYFALDDFHIGTRSQGCQRLVKISYALQKTVHVNGGYQLAFGTRPTIAAYGPQCSTMLIANKVRSLNYRTFIYTVRDYPQQRAIDGILFSNLVYDQQNMGWRFRVDCNGHQEQGLFLSAYLVLLNGAPGWFDIFIKLVHPTVPELSVKRELTHYFTVHSSWGIPHFVEFGQIAGFLSQTQLKFEYGMRPARVDEEK